jgi:hypothetical protein
MYSKMSFVVCAAAVVLLAGAPVAVAKDSSNRNDTAPNAHQTALDEEYARTHQTIVPGTPATNGTSYGYVPPHRPIHKHR